MKQGSNVTAKNSKKARRQRFEKKVALHELTQVNYNKTVSKRLFVGGLPYETTEDELKEAFSNSGTVEAANIITDKMTGRSKGFGFVEMSTDEEAEAAVQAWNKKDFNGRTLTVDIARPKAE